MFNKALLMATTGGISIRPFFRARITVGENIDENGEAFSRGYSTTTGIGECDVIWSDYDFFELTNLLDSTRDSSGMLSFSGVGMSRLRAYNETTGRVATYDLATEGSILYQKIVGNGIFDGIETGDSCVITIGL